MPCPLSASNLRSYDENLGVSRSGGPPSGYFNLCKKCRERRAPNLPGWHAPCRQPPEHKLFVLRDNVTFDSICGRRHSGAPTVYESALTDPICCYRSSRVGQEACSPDILNNVRNVGSAGLPTYPVTRRGLANAGTGFASRRDRFSVNSSTQTVQSHAGMEDCCSTPV